jgi:hypothetical protein
MGLLPPDSVLPPVIGLHGTTIGDVIDVHGPRTPAWPDAQAAFAMAAVVIHDRLLTETELALFDFLIAEFGAESAHPLRTNTTVKTFFQATGGRHA